MRCSSQPDSKEQALLERMRTLYARLDDARRHTSEYERLSAHIHKLSIAYCQLVDGHRKSSVELTLDPG
jgi:hypothetical protein